MADVTEVMDTLTGIISGLVYPNGTSKPSVGGVDARIFVGWPVPATLAADLANGACQVSVYQLPGERNTTRYLKASLSAFLNTPTLTLSMAGQTVTVGGTIPPASNPHNAVVFVNYIPYVYAVQPTDTLSSIATALATLISGGAFAGAPLLTESSSVLTTELGGPLLIESAGPVIYLPQSAVLTAARIGVTGTSVVEIARQEKQFLISIWANSPKSRTALAKTIDPALKALTFILLPDFTSGRIRYVSNRESDEAQKQQIYRRDLIFTVEYATTQTQTTTQITQTQLNVTAANQPAITVFD